MLSEWKLSHLGCSPNTPDYFRHLFASKNKYYKIRVYASIGHDNMTTARSLKKTPIKESFYLQNIHRSNGFKSSLGTLTCFMLPSIKSHISVFKNNLFCLFLALSQSFRDSITVMTNNKYFI